MVIFENIIMAISILYKYVGYSLAAEHLHFEIGVGLSLVIGLKVAIALRPLSYLSFVLNPYS